MTLARTQNALIADGLLKSARGQNSTDLSLLRARAKGERGIASSAQHAEDDRPGWGEMALTMVRWFAKVQARQPPINPYVIQAWEPSKAWTAEECRLWCSAHDLPDPPELRAWGSVIQRALREGLIVKTGGFRATSSSNGAVRALYRKA